MAAGAPPDVELERELVSDLARVLAEVSVSGHGVRDEAAEGRLAAAQAALQDAEGDVEAFRWTRAEDLAAELAAMARDLTARYVPVAEEILRLEREYVDVLAAWREILEPLGLAARDLPESPAASGRFGQIQPPMPVPLMLDDEMAPVARAAWEARQAAGWETAERAQLQREVEEQRQGARAAAEIVQ